MASEDDTLDGLTEESRPETIEALRLAIEAEIRALYASEPPSRARTARAFVTASRAMMSWALCSQNTAGHAASSGRVNIFESLGALPRLSVLYSDHVLHFMRSLKISINSEDEDAQIAIILDSSEIFLEARDGIEKWKATVSATDVHVVVRDMYEWLGAGYETFVASLNKLCDDIIAAYDKAAAMEYSHNLEYFLTLASYAKHLLAHLSLTEEDAYKNLLDSVARRRAIFDENGELLRHETILECSLDAAPNTVWTALQTPIPFPDPMPPPLSSPSAPDPADRKFAPRKSVFDRFFQNLAIKRAKEAEDRYKTSLAEWTEQNSDADLWKSRNGAWITFQQRWSASVVRHRERYLDGKEEEVVGYCHEVVSRQWNFCQNPRSHYCAYTPATKMLVVDYQLPPPEDLPAPHQTGRPKSRAATTKNPIYDGALYQLCLGALHRLFAADEADAIE